MRKTTTSGVKVARLLKDGRYRATISSDGMSYNLGAYETLEETQEVKDKAIHFY